MKQSFVPFFALALAACGDNQSYIGFNSYDGSYIPGEHELYGPTIQTFVRGGPYPGLQPSAETDAVLADMQEGGFPETLFTTEPVGRSPYRVLMVFAPAPNTNLDRLCEMDARELPNLPAIATTGDDKRIWLAAAFCRADRLMGGAIGTLPVSVAANDPAVKGSIQAFMRQLFPANNPTLGPGGDTPN
jgi:hypothetical protein